MKINPKNSLAQNVIEIFRKVKKGRSLGLKDWEQGLVDQASVGLTKESFVTYIIVHCYQEDNTTDVPNHCKVLLNGVQLDDQVSEDLCCAFIQGHSQASGWTEVLIQYEVEEPNEN